MASFDEFKKELYELFSQGHITEAQYEETLRRYLKPYNQVAEQADDLFLDLQKTQDEIYRYNQSNDNYD